MGALQSEGLGVLSVATRILLRPDGAKPGLSFLDRGTNALSVSRETFSNDAVRAKVGLWSSVVRVLHLAHLKIDVPRILNSLHRRLDKLVT